ncbi:AcfA family outer membrane beta-barrel protein [Vibrio vulnificus]|uniref:AcfA family outer membrane beta-barrel protein n=1 Tax=Vibrio vulnificus TaxID=672 RepID=UPI000500548F|nr:AcfA family outer membrane beta-barrel protein [Vibrio vulnificus]KFK52272.1 organic solvent ABC transporter substrate-binding protein [Vibrio vulnificus]KFK52626.1 organic solvent ABC transporter substrate-binding protein [Vibrio vulnificus]HDY8229909.1 AcfA family outer membrane beta-barrel protein [Vibrio vulnificus]
MNKTLLTAILISASFSAISSPYIGLEYGLGSTRHDDQSRFTSSPEVKLNPSNEDGILGGFIGYSLSSQWAIELGYNQFDLEADRSRFVKFDPTTHVKTEEEWHSRIKAKQFTFAPVYTYTLSERWQAKFKAGLTYTQYDVSGSHYLEDENELTDVETITPKSSYANLSNEFGGLLSVGTEYEVYSQLMVGVNIKYQFDSFANTASFNIGSTYYF